MSLAGCSESKPTFNAVDLTGAEYARDFKLTDMNGQVRTLGDFKGKVVVVFFGYAQCPDVCPTTMTEMAQVKQKLGKDGDKLQVVFITVDPERDTPEIMKAYMGAFDPAFVALIPNEKTALALKNDLQVSTSLVRDQYIEGPWRTIYLPIRMSVDVFPVKSVPLDTLLGQIQGFIERESDEVSLPV